MHETTLCTAHLEPAFWHEEVVLDALFPELLSSVEAHGPVLIVDLPLVLITENGVGIVDLLEFLCGFRVVWVLVRMMPQRKFPRSRQEDTSCCWYSRMPESKNAHKLRTTATEKWPEATWSNFWQVAVSLCKYTQPGSVSLSLSLIKINQNWVMAIIENESTVNGKKSQYHSKSLQVLTETNDGEAPTLSNRRKEYLPLDYTIWSMWKDLNQVNMICCEGLHGRWGF